MGYKPEYDKKTTVEERAAAYSRTVRYVGGEVQLAMQAAVMSAYVEGYRDLLATIAADRTKIARLEKIEERAKEVLREREDSTAAYILEGGTRHVGKPDARKGAAK
jgi:hypothetical protein